MHNTIFRNLDTPYLLFRDKNLLFLATYLYTVSQMVT